LIPIPAVDCCPSSILRPSSHSRPLRPLSPPPLSCSIRMAQYFRFKDFYLLFLRTFKPLKSIFIYSCYFYNSTTLKFFIFSTLLLPTLAFVSSNNIRLYIYFEDDLYLFLLLLLCYILIHGIYSFSVFWTISTYFHFYDDITVCSVVYSSYLTFFFFSMYLS
jgi:hypothetical protein